MREIKFRGKSIESGEWVYGSLLQSEVDVNELSVRCQIHGRFAHEFSIDVWDVFPKSVGQFTGLRDKNGKEIYEGDWCRACFRDKDGFHYVQGTIFMDEYMWCLEAQGSVMNGEIFSINRLHDWEVLGNIYEHKHELLNSNS